MKKSAEKKIVITGQRLLDLGFTYEDEESYELQVCRVETPEYHSINLWARPDMGLTIFMSVNYGNMPDQTDTELAHIKHIDELQNLFFALTGTKLEYKQNNNWTKIESENDLPKLKKEYHVVVNGVLGKAFYRGSDRWIVAGNDYPKTTETHKITHYQEIVTPEAPIY